MRDSQTIFTGVGVIATLLAFLFAFAAYYAQNRRRAERERLTKKNAPPARPAAAPAKPAVEQDSGDAASVSRAEPGSAPAAGGGSTPLFKKYSIQSMPVSPSAQENREEFQWD